MTGHRNSLLLRSPILGAFLRILWKELFELYQKPSMPLALLAASLLVVWTSSQLNIQQPRLGLYLYSGDAAESAVANAQAILAEFANIEIVGRSEGSLVDMDEMSGAGASLAAVHLEGGWLVLHRFATARQEAEVAQLAQLIGYSLRTGQPLSALLLKVEQPASTGFSTRMPALPGQPQVLLVPRTIALVVVFLPFVLATRSYTREVTFGMLPTVLGLPQSGWGVMAAGKLAACLWLVLCVLLALFLVIKPLFGISPKPGLMLQFGIQSLAIFSSAALGLLFAILARNQSHIHISIAVYFLALVLVSGFLFPLDTASSIIRWASFASPLTFSGQIMESWLFFGTSPLVFWRYILILGLQAVTAAALLIVTISVARRRV